jgi:hypothetical protein
VPETSAYAASSGHLERGYEEPHKRRLRRGPSGQSRGLAALKPRVGLGLIFFDQPLKLFFGSGEWSRTFGVVATGSSFFGKPTVRPLFSRRLRTAASFVLTSCADTVGRFFAILGFPFDSSV